MLSRQGGSIPLEVLFQELKGTSRKLGSLSHGMPSRHEEVSLGGRLYGQVALSGQETSNFRGALKLNYTTNTNKSPQLVFAAAIVAASLQLFALPGLAIEHQQNPAQRGSSSNTKVIYAQDNLLGLRGDNKANKLKYLELLGIISSFIGVIISLLNLYLKEIPKIKTELVQAENDRRQMEEDRKEMTEKLLEIVNILNR